MADSSRASVATGLVVVALFAAVGPSGAVSPSPVPPAGSARQPFAHACAAAGLPPAASPLRLQSDPPPERPLEPGHAAMVRRLAELAERHPVAAPFLRDVLRQRERLDALSSRDAQTAYATALRALAEAELRAGMIVESIDHLDQAIANMRGIRGSARLRLTLAARFWLGVARLRMLEQRLCGDTVGPACVLPTLPYAEQLGDQALAAAEDLRATMELSPGSNPLHESARWLLNVATMMLGQDPADLDEAERVPLPAGVPPVPFAEVGAEVGLGDAFLAGGLVVDDFDGDGWFDLVVSSHDLRAPLRVYRNVGGRSFERVAAGLEGIGGGRNLVQADYDGDGDLDLFVARGGVLGGGLPLPDSLLRNDGGLRFTDATESAGLGAFAGPSWSAAWADYDGDGDLDLFVARGVPPGGDRRAAALPGSALLRNDGGAFVDATDALDADGPLYARAGAWGDYDGDGDLDLFVAGTGGPARLLRNEGARLRDVTDQSGLAGERDVLAAWFADFDGDGSEDLLLLHSAPSGAGPPPIWRFVAWRTGSAAAAPAPALYRYEGERFVPAAAGVGLIGSVMALGAGFGDLDDDGRLDLHVGTGYPAPEALLPDLTFAGSPGGFELLPFSTGLASLAAGNAVAFADWDRDGDQDLFVQAGGYRPGGQRRPLLFDNGGVAAARSYLALALRGPRGNPSAVGALVRVHTSGPEGRRSLLRRVGAASGFGAAPLELHFGIDRGERVTTVQVRWPGARDFVAVAGVQVGGRFLLAYGEEEARPAPPANDPHATAPCGAPAGATRGC